MANIDDEELDGIETFDGVDIDSDIRNISHMVTSSGEIIPLECEE